MEARVIRTIRFVHDEAQDQRCDRPSCHSPLDDLGDAVKVSRQFVQVQRVLTRGMRKPNIVPTIEGLPQQVDTANPTTPLERVPTLLGSFYDLAARFVELGVRAGVDVSSGEEGRKENEGHVG